MPYNLKIHPNPVNNQLQIELPEATICQYRLYAQGGQILQSGELRQSGSLNMHHLPAALSILELVTPDNRIYRLKVVKQ